MYGFEFIFTELDRVFYYDVIEEEENTIAVGICYCNDGTVYNFIQAL